MSIQSVGRFTYGHDGITIYDWGHGPVAKIGSFCSIAGGCRFYLGGNHNTNYVSTYPFGNIYKEIFSNGKAGIGKLGDIVIGNDVWIGHSATIMTGVTVGSGAVIAANSHVVKDVEPYSIVGGNPAKHIRYRFTPSQIERLLTLQWWDWPIGKINENLHLICSTNVEELLNAAK